MICFFFGIGHGKGAYDGARAIIKWFLWPKKLNAHGVLLKNTADVVNFQGDRLSKRPKVFYVH
jgi:hypothetical protein